ncbi:MAG TPA: hypothetical protein VFF27_07525 [Bacteroidia bacterium]|nr:hypothetical protein [Bacteroidia bacterium]
MKKIKIIITFFSMVQKNRHIISFFLILVSFKSFGQNTSLKELSTKQEFIIEGVDGNNRNELRKQIKQMFPDSICKDVYRLTILSAIGDSIPFETTKFPNLQSLTLTSGPIPLNIGEYRRLQILVIKGAQNNYYDPDKYHSDVNYALFPESFWLLKNLKVLVIQNSLPYLSERIIELENLEILAMPLAFLPVSIMNLKHLKAAYVTTGSCNCVYKLKGKDLKNKSKITFEKNESLNKINSAFEFDEAFTPQVNLVRNENEKELMIYYPNEKQANKLQVALHGFFQNSKPDSLWQKWNEQGVLISKKECFQNKKKHTALYRTNGLETLIITNGDSIKIIKNQIQSVYENTYLKISEEDYYKNEPNRYQEWDFQTGNLIADKHFKNYKLHGKITQGYIVDGKYVKIESNYSNGVKIE